MKMDVRKNTLSLWIKLNKIYYTYIKSEKKIERLLGIARWIIPWTNIKYIFCRVEKNIITGKYNGEKYT